jgi:hypothetical protein
MSNLEARLADIERRLAALEARDRVEPRPVGSQSPEQPPRKEPLVKLSVSNKRFDPANPALDSYEDHIWFDCIYILSKKSKPTRAIKGVLEFADLFGEVQLRLNTTLNQPLSPGKTVTQPGTGFAYNQFMSEHQWMLATSLADMKCSFKVLNVIYSDGTSESFA